MTGFRVSAAALVATVAVAGAAAGVALAATEATPKPKPKVVVFTATYKGTAVVKVTDQVADIQATGTGTATVIGAGRITGKGTGDASQQPCVPFTGTGTMTGTGGTKLVFKMLTGSSGCGDEAGQVFSLLGRAQVLGGAGKLAKAKGTLKLTGVYDRGAGTFSAKFTGKLTY